MNRYLIVLLVATLAISQTATPSSPATPPRSGLAPSSPGRARVASDAAASKPVSPVRRSPRKHIHITPITPAGTRIATTRIYERLDFQHQAFIPADILVALDTAAASAVSIDGRTHRHGILLAEQRATHNFPYNLRTRIARYRNPAEGGIETSLGGNGSPMSFHTPGKKGNLKHQFKHIVSLRTAIEVIKLGNTFIRHCEETGRPFLVFIAPAKILSNEPLIGALIGKWDEIQIAFGYPKDSTDGTNPFFLFHAMGDITARRLLGERAVDMLTPVAGVKAFLEENAVYGRILRFDLSTVREMK